MATLTWKAGTVDQAPTDYHPAPQYRSLLQEHDVMVPMRDGVKLAIDIYRPDAQAKVPALLSIAQHNKDMLRTEVAAALPPQPAWSHLWAGSVEAGDTEFLTAHGYAHIGAQARGSGKSEDGGSPAFDYYDLIEWIAAQPWCDGNVGMIGCSAYGRAQFEAAVQAPPHLKAIFPFDPGPVFFRDRYPGGVVHTFSQLVGAHSVEHHHVKAPGTLPGDGEAHWQEAMSNPDYLMYPSTYNVLTMKGQTSRPYFALLLNPFESEAASKAAEANFDKVKIPVYTGSGWYAHTYKSHFQGSQSWYRGLKGEKRFLMVGPAHMERPWRGLASEAVKWYDQWLKGIDTGVKDEPPVKLWVMGANKWLLAPDWPLPQTQWTKFYLNSWERLRREPFVEGSRDNYAEPDTFVQMPLTHTRRIEKLRYMTEPLAEDTLVAGPIVLNLHAAIDQEDVNWIVVLKDVGPDGSVRTARPGEENLPTNLPERELTRGWLKASNRAVDPARSKPWKPWHVMTRKASTKVVPGEIIEYAIEIMATGNLFRAGHRICIDITSMDAPMGTGGGHSVEYIPYHINSSKTVVHKVFHNHEHPSHLLLPLIPLKEIEEG